MNDSTGGRDRSERLPDRGQIVLVTALILATTLIGLATVLNTSIYAENQATRRSDVDTSKGVEFTDLLDDNAGVPLAKVNHAKDYSGYTPIQDNYARNLTNVTEPYAESAARRGVAWRPEIEGYNRGTRVVQESVQPFTPRDSGLLSDTIGTLQSVLDLGDPSYPIAGDVRARRFRMDVHRSEFDHTFLEADVEAELSGTANLEAELGVAVNDYDGPFRVGFDDDEDGDSEAMVAIYGEDTDGDDDPEEVVVTGWTESRGVLGSCSATVAEAEVNLSTGSFEGEDCAAADVMVGLSGSYDVFFISGENAGGTYEVTVDRAIEDADESGDAEGKADGLKTTVDDEAGALSDWTDIAYDSSSSSSPRYEEAIYAANVTSSMDSSRLEYGSDVEAAPEQPDDG